MNISDSDSVSTARRPGPSGAASPADKLPPKCDVIVPVLNERQMLPRFLARLRALDIPMNVIMVDNASTDGTIEFIEADPETTLIMHDTNLGYGRSLADGLLASSAERVIIIDADCEYPPEAIPAILERLDKAEVVYTTRFRGPDADMSWTRSTGNRWLTGLFNLLYSQRLTDLYTGMKGMRRTAFAGLEFEHSGFEHVAELAAKMARKQIRFAEVPVQYAPRQTGRSKMRHVPELLKAVWCLAYYRVARNV